MVSGLGSDRVASARIGSLWLGSDQLAAAIQIRNVQEIMALD